MKDAKGHHWYTPKRAKWLTHCALCGLVALKNEASQKAVRAPCRAAHLFQDKGVR